MQKQILIFTIFLSSYILAQQATDYFPSINGFKWYSKTTMLDSLNQEIDTLTVFEIDSLVGETTYKGLQSKYILGKSGPDVTILYQPYIDTSYVSLQGTEAKTYFGLGAINSLTGLLDSNIIDSTLLGVLRILSSLEGWYPTYKFANSVNSSYTLFTKDTTITIDSTSLPLRFQLKAKRVNDGTLSTEIGTFNCKKFVMSYSVSYILLPIFPIPLVTIADTHYVAQGNWLVKTIAPSTTLDLTVVQLGSFTIPGRSWVVIPPILPNDVEENNPVTVVGYELSQNYPNPFNPSTTIRYSVPDAGFVSLKVYDNIGNLVAILANEQQQAGTHQISFDAAKLASGVYFYRMESNGFSETKRMILIK